MKRLLFILLTCTVSSVWAQEDLAQEGFSSDPLEAYRQHYMRATDLLSAKPRTSLFHAELALKNAQQTSETEKVAKAHFLTAKIAYHLEEYVLAYEHFVEAKEAFNQVGNQVYEHWCQHNMGAIHIIAGEYDKAHANLQEAREFLLSHVSVADKALLFRDQGKLILEQQNYTLAIKQYKKGLQIAPSDGRNLSYAYTQIAFCFKKLEKPDSANYYYYLAFIQSQKESLPFIMAKSGIDLGLFALDQGDYKAAMSYLVPSYAAIQNTWIPFATRARLMNTLARSYFQSGQSTQGFGILSDLMDLEGFATGSEVILYTYDLLIQEYLLPNGDTVAVREARKERSYHRDRITSELRDITPIVAAGVFLIDADKESTRKSSLLFKIVLAAAIFTTAFLVFYIMRSRKQKRQLYQQLAQIQSASEKRELQVDKFAQMLSDFANGRRIS